MASKELSEILADMQDVAYEMMQAFSPEPRIDKLRAAIQKMCPRARMPEKVSVKAGGEELGYHEYLKNIGIDAIGHGNIYQPEFAGEVNRRLAAS